MQSIMYFIETKTPGLPISDLLGSEATSSK